MAAHQRVFNVLELSHEVTFPQANIGTKVDYKEVKEAFENTMEGELTTIELTGERGYRTAIAGHGVKHGDFFFEVEMLAHPTPTPFVDVVPAIRVGLTNFGEQSLEMPLGATMRSYAYSSTGKLITNSKFSSKLSNEPYSKCKLLRIGRRRLAASNARPCLILLFIVCD